MEELAERTSLLVRHFPRSQKRETIQLNTIADSLSSGILESTYLIQRIVKLIEEKRKWITESQTDEVTEIIGELEKQVESLSSAASRLQIALEKPHSPSESESVETPSLLQRTKTHKRRNG